MQVQNLPGGLALSLSLAAILVGMTAPAAAQDCGQLAANWPHGPADAVFTAHGRSYFGSGTVLVIGDVSDIFNPRIEGSIDLGMLIGDIVVEDRLARVAAGNFDGGEGALFTVDTTDPTNPVVVNQTFFPMPAQSVTIAGDIAYVGLVDPLHPTQGRLVAVNVTFPDTAVTLSLPGWPEELTLDGDLLWVNELGTGVRAFDVSSSLNPAEAAFAPGNIRDFDVDNGVLYLAEWGDTGGDSLRIVDVTDPTSPLELARFAATRPRNVEVFGRIAFMLSAVSETSIRLELIDVSIPQTPERLGIMTIPAGGGDLLINDLSVAASIAYVTHSQGGPVVVNAVDATEPTVAAGFATPGLAMSLALDDGMLAVAGGSSGLAVIDLTADGSGLPTLSSPPLPFAQDVALAHRHAFVASWGDGVRVYDVADPGHPVEVAVIETGYSFFRTVASGDHLYASFLGSPYVGTTIFDISNPANPVEVAELQGSVLAVDRGYAYADWSDWLGQCALATWDVSNPAQPGSEPSRINIWGGCARCDWPWPSYRRSYELDPHRAISGISIRGNVAWVALGQEGLKVLSLADPSSPSQSAALDVAACGVTGVAAHRGSAYVATHSPSGLLTVRMNGAGELSSSGFVPLAGFPADAILSDGTVYTANQTAGLSAIDVTACQPPLRAAGRRAP